MEEFDLKTGNLMGAPAPCGCALCARADAPICASAQVDDCVGARRAERVDVRDWRHCEHLPAGGACGAMSSCIDYRPPLVRASLMTRLVVAVGEAAVVAVVVVVAAAAAAAAVARRQLAAVECGEL